MSQTRRDMLHSLQIGRAIAALAVVLCHAIGTAQRLFPELPVPVFKLLELGYLGVDYFFVLSGFIIAHTTWDKPRDGANAKRYALSRAVRIYVPYLPIALGLMAVFALIPSMAEHNVYSLEGSLLLVPSNDLPVLTVAWSLQHELVFYVLFGLCFFWLRNPALIFLWVIPMLVLPFIEFPRWGNVVAGFFNLEFLLGVAACYLYRAKRFYAARHALVVLGAVVLVAGVTILFYGAIPHYYRVIPGLGFALIVLGLVHIERDVDFSRRRVGIFMGSASYALYLVHAVFMYALLKLPIPFPHWSVAFLFFAVAATAAGIAYHLVIEKPLLAFVRKRLVRGGGE